MNGELGSCFSNRFYSQHQTTSIRSFTAEA